MPTETFTYNSNSSQTWTVPSGVSTIQIEAYGAGGGTSEFTGGSNNSGGYAKADVGVSPGDVIELWIAEPVSGVAGSWGRYNGGDGESDASGGGGSTEARNSTTGTDLIGAGGGGGDHSNGGHNGGGGAQGGNGGSNAEDGGGSLSFGGDGGQGFSSPDAEPGDGHVYNGTNTETTVGGGNAPESGGTIVIKYGLTAPTGVGVTASAENENTVTHDQPPTGDPDGYNYYRGEYDASWPGGFTLVGSNDAQTNTQFVDTSVPEDGERYEYVVTSRTDIPDSGVARWKFDEGSGSTATDAWGSNDGSITGATYTSTAAVGSYALSFGGGDGDYVTYPSQGSRYDGTTDYTITAWVVLGSASSERRVVWHPRADYDVWLATSGSNDIEVGYYDGSVNTAGTALATGSYAFVAMRWDSDGDQVLTVDSTHNAASQPTSPPNSTSASNAIGGDPGGPSFSWNGRIDDPRDYDKYLSDSELDNLRTTGSIDG